MSIARGTTPTFHLTFSENQLDLTTANNVYVTFEQNTRKLTKSGEALVVHEKQIDVYLDQKDTLGFRVGGVEVQANWTMANGRRASSEICVVEFSKQLLERVIE